VTGSGLSCSAHEGPTTITPSSSDRSHPRAAIRDQRQRHARTRYISTPTAEKYKKGRIEVTQRPRPARNIFAAVYFAGAVFAAYINENAGEKKLYEGGLVRAHDARPESLQVLARKADDRRDECASRNAGLSCAVTSLSRRPRVGATSSPRHEGVFGTCAWRLACGDGSSNRCNLRGIASARPRDGRWPVEGAVRPAHPTLEGLKWAKSPGGRRKGKVRSSLAGIETGERHLRRAALAGRTRQFKLRQISRNLRAAIMANGPETGRGAGEGVLLLRPEPGQQRDARSCASPAPR